jgi:hypothetical protein
LRNLVTNYSAFTQFLHPAMGFSDSKKKIKKGSKKPEPKQPEPIAKAMSSHDKQATHDKTEASHYTDPNASTSSQRTYEAGYQAFDEDLKTQYATATRKVLRWQQHGPEKRGR